MITYERSAAPGPRLHVLKRLERPADALPISIKQSGAAYTVFNFALSDRRSGFVICNVDARFMFGKSLVVEVCA